MEYYSTMKKILFLLLFIYFNNSFSQDGEYDGTGSGAIADGLGACGGSVGAIQTTSFDVLNEATILRDLNININIEHTWLGDIVARLVSPDGASFVLFGRTGATTATSCGDGSILQGDYIFGDTGTSNWWVQAGFASNGIAIPTSLSYRTSEIGGNGQSNPAPQTNLEAFFENVPNINGTWKLEVTDTANGDTGTVVSATLFIETALFVNGFES